VETATCIADDNASVDEMWTYVREVSWIAAGTKAVASLSELVTKMTVKITPKVIWNSRRVYVRLIQELVVRVVLSLMTL
jgi:hypothetical protein